MIPRGAVQHYRSRSEGSTTGFGHAGRPRRMDPGRILARSGGRAGTGQPGGRWQTRHPEPPTPFAPGIRIGSIPPAALPAAALDTLVFVSLRFRRPGARAIRIGYA